MNYKIAELHKLTQHLIRTQSYAELLARDLGLNEDDIMKVGIAAFFHDFGKLLLNPDILNAERTLSQVEFEHIKEHVCLSNDIANMLQIPDEIKSIMFQHHEDYNGKGYPLSLKGNEICLEARILRVVDFFDSLNSDRPYRSKLPVVEALEQMDDNIGKLDQNVFNVFSAVTINRIENFEVSKCKPKKTQNNVDYSFLPKGVSKHEIN